MVHADVDLNLVAARCGVAEVGSRCLSTLRMNVRTHRVQRGALRQRVRRTQRHLVDRRHRAAFSGQLRRGCGTVDVRVPGRQRQRRVDLVLQEGTQHVEVDRRLARVALVLGVRVAQARRVRAHLVLRSDLRDARALERIAAVVTRTRIAQRTTETRLRGCVRPPVRTLVDSTEVAAGDRQTTLSVVRGHRPRLTRTHRTGNAAERVRALSLEAVVERRNILHGVVLVRRVVVVVDVARGRECRRRNGVARQDLNHFRHGVELAPHTHGTVLIGREAHVGLAVEQRTRGTDGPLAAYAACTDVEAVFDLEDGLETAAEVFRPPEAPLVRTGGTAIEAEPAVAVDVRRVSDTRIEHAIQGNRRLCHCCRRCCEGGNSDNADLDFLVFHLYFTVRSGFGIV